MKVLVTGATGFIGQRFVSRLLEAGHQATVISRSPGTAKRQFHHSVVCIDWKTPLPPCDGVVNLMGESIAQRWNEDVKADIRSSRVGATRLLTERLAGRPLRFFVSASAVGFYGSRGEEELTEELTSGSDFLAHVCRDWEQAVLQSTIHGRKVVFRFGMVLGRGGGALAKILPIFKLGLGGPIGDGSQWMSWIHLDDLVEALFWACNDERASGVYNAVSPDPVTGEVFTEKLGKILKRPTWFRVPGKVLKIAAGEMSSVLLSSQRALPKRLEEAGFRFRYETLESALSAVVSDR